MFKNSTAQDYASYNIPSKNIQIWNLDSEESCQEKKINTRLKHNAGVIALWILWTTRKTKKRVLEQVVRPMWYITYECWTRIQKT